MMKDKKFIRYIAHGSFASYVFSFFSSHEKGLLFFSCFSSHAYNGYRQDKHPHVSFPAVSGG